LGSFLFVFYSLSHGRVVFHVRVQDESSQRIIHLRVSLILNDSKDVETRKDGIGELHIVIEVAIDSVDSTNGIGSSNNCASGL